MPDQCWTFWTGQGGEWTRDKYSMCVWGYALYDYISPRVGKSYSPQTSWNHLHHHHFHFSLSSFIIIALSPIWIPRAPLVELVINLPVRAGVIWKGVVKVKMVLPQHPNSGQYPHCLPKKQLFPFPPSPNTGNTGQTVLISDPFPATAITEAS